MSATTLAELTLYGTGRAWRCAIARYLPGGGVGPRTLLKLSTLTDWERDRAGARCSAPEGTSVREHRIFTAGDSEAQGVYSGDDIGSAGVSDAAQDHWKRNVTA